MAPGTPHVGEAAASAPQPAPALPETLPARFARQQVCALGNCALAGWLPDPSYAESPLEAVSAQAAIWVHVLAAGAKLTLPANTALELVIVCLGGELGVRDTMSPPDSESLPVRLSPWTALRAASAGVELSCATGECRAMFALIAPRSTLAAAVRATPSTSPRSVPLEVRAFEDVAVASFGQGKNHARVLFGGDATSSALPFSLTLLESDAPAHIATHAHERSWENLLVLEGLGDLELRGHSYPIEGGESLHIAPRIRHGYVARGQTRFVALQLYTPAGPEQRFLEPTQPTPAAAASTPSARVRAEPP